MSKRAPYPSELKDRFIIRLPDGMRDRIKAAADLAQRSMNAEILATLADAYPEPVNDAKAFELIRYILAASTPAETETRKEEVRKMLEAMNSGARLYDGPNVPEGNIAIAKPRQPKP